MAISQIPSNYLQSDDFQLISSVTPSVATSVNFTSLGLYRKLLVTITDCVLASASVVRIRLNNDATGGNYFWNYFSWISSTTTIQTGLGSGFQASISNSTTQQNRFLLIENCDKTGLKIATAGAGRIGSEYSQTLNQLYLGTSVISQLNVVSAQNFTAVGNISLYGAK